MEIADYDPHEHLFATRYQQGSRVVYSLHLTLEHVAALIREPDPNEPTEGNRRISPDHAAKFAHYLRTQPNWVAPALMLRSSDIFSFEVRESIGGSEFGLLSFPKIESAALKILDGQHRILGIHLARTGIALDKEKKRSALSDARRNGDGVSVKSIQRELDFLTAQAARLSGERIALQIYIENDQKAYRQMFFDIADNALGIKASVKALFDSTKVLNRSLPAIAEHKLLKDRIDTDQDRVTGANPNLLGMNQVAEIARTLVVGLDGRIGRRLEDELTEDDFIQRSRRFFDVLLAAFLPLAGVASGMVKPEQLRKSSMLGSTTMLRALAGTYRELEQSGRFEDEEVVRFFSLIAPHFEGPVQEGGIWIEHVGGDIFSVGALAPTSRRQNLRELQGKFLSWAANPPSWLGPTI